MVANAMLIYHVPERVGFTQTLEGCWSVAVSITLDGPLTFLGHEVTQEDRSVVLVTYWQVIDKPAQPLPLMAHLVGTEGRPVAVGDGLGVSWDQLQPEDLLAQCHFLSSPRELSGGSYWLQTGDYWSDMMERWNVLVDEKAMGDRVLLTSLEIP